MVNNASSDFIEKKHIDYQEPLENSVLIWIDTLLVVLWKKQQQDRHSALFPEVA